MTEEDARSWIEARVSRETMQRLEQLAALVREENGAQNLVAAATLDHIWARHIADSLQLLELLPQADPGKWCDLGTGAGFPGLAIACAAECPMLLVEVRRRRAEFLQRAVVALGLGERVRIAQTRVESLQESSPFGVISARAFAPLDRLFASAAHLSSRKTIWLLPKGQGGAEELEAARRTWQGDFRLASSRTDPASVVLVAQNVRPRRST